MIKEKKVVITNPEHIFCSD